MEGDIFQPKFAFLKNFHFPVRENVPLNVEEDFGWKILPRKTYIATSQDRFWLENSPSGRHCDCKLTFFLALFFFTGIQRDLVKWDELFHRRRGSSASKNHAVEKERKVALLSFLPSVFPSSHLFVLPPFRPSALSSVRPSFLPFDLPFVRPSFLPSVPPSFFPSFLPSVLLSFPPSLITSSFSGFLSSLLLLFFRPSFLTTSLLPYVLLG
jgi:hypothetical protein